MRFFSLLFLVLIALSPARTWAQGTTAPQVFNFVEQMPEFPGGNDQLMQYLSANIHYPQMARESNIEGRVIIKFVVSETGEITDVQAIRKIGGGCDEEAIRVVKAMPRWKPGTQEGRPVKVFFTLPITFRLEGGSEADEYPAIAFHSKEEIAIYKQAMIALGAKEYTVAETAIGKALALNPGNPYTYLAQGLVYLQQGDINRCETAFGKAYTASLKTDSLHRLAGGITSRYLLQAYTVNGKYEKALQLVQQEKAGFTEASSLNVEYATFIALGKKTDAQLLTMVADLDRKWDNCEAMAELGRRYERNGRVTAAFLMYSLQNFVNPNGKFSASANIISQYYLAYILSGVHKPVKTTYKDALTPLDTLVSGLIDSNLTRDEMLAKATRFVKGFNKIAAKHPSDPLVTMYADLMRGIEAGNLYEDYTAGLISGINGLKQMRTQALDDLLNNWYTGSLKQEK